MRWLENKNNFAGRTPEEESKQSEKKQIPFLNDARRQTILLKTKPWLGYFLIFGLSFIIFLYILMPPGIACPDSFYHTKMALMIKQNGLLRDFPWTQFTSYKDLFVDHHFGYHYLLIPFLLLPTPKNLDPLSAEIDPLIKTKIGAAFFAAAVFLAIYWLLRRLKTKAPLLWTSSAFLILPFLTRLSFTRAPAVSVIILILGFYSLIFKKHFLLFIFSFFYVWLYGAWPLMLLSVLIYCFAKTCQELNNQWTELSQKIKNKKSKTKNTDKKFKNIFLFLRLCFSSFIFYLLYLTRRFFTRTNIKLLCACILGLCLGLIINPYFPKTLPFYWFQTVKIAVLNYHQLIGVGAEWYPPKAPSFFFNILPLLIFWLISLAWFISAKKNRETSSWFFLFISIFFLFYTLKARRNVEYFIPSAIFFSALNFAQIGEKINWKKIKEHFNKLFQGPENIFYFISAIFFVFLSGFFVILYFNQSIKDARDLYAGQRLPLTHLQTASRWLKDKTQPGEIIFQSRWDIFPELFYFNDANYYINGLDQTFMYEKNKNLYKIWADLVNNKTDPKETASLIKEKFGAGYILFDKRDEKFGQLLKKSTNMEKAYEDQEAIIYKIK